LINPVASFGHYRFILFWGQKYWQKTIPVADKNWVKKFTLRGQYYKTTHNPTPLTPANDEQLN
jgi:hypothetical protein